MAEQADIVIAGGGPVGATLALALRDSGFSICVIEPKPLTPADAEEGRALALSHGSRLILERIGVWQQLASVTPIEQIHISQQRGFGRAELSAAEVDVPALGYIVGYSTLARALEAALTAADIPVLRGCALKHTQPHADTVHLDIEGHGELSARLLAIADGGATTDIAEVKTHRYAQTALTCEVITTQPHRQRAFERFTPAGPIALLPNPRGWSLVWVAAPERTEALIALDETTFCRELRNAFGAALGDFSLSGPRRSFPLVLNYATAPRQPRTVLLGAAAQTLHPVAGQGLNLGLRDAWELARTFVVQPPDDPGAEAVLTNHRKIRRRDRIATTAFTDSLIRLFCNDIPLLQEARGLGLALFGGLPPARKFLMKRMLFGARG
jgi:2-octaprenyl-6-methoxyphenol hydroxylase